jgi:hypothetical protein
MRSENSVWMNALDDDQRRRYNRKFKAASAGYRARRARRIERRNRK